MIAWAPTRDAAIDRLNRGLEETDIRGVVTNIPFLSALVTHPKVRANAIDTGFIERELKNLTPEAPPPGDLELCAAVAAILQEEQKAARAEAHSPWRTSGWMPVGRRQRVFSFRHGQGGEHKVTLTYGSGPATLSIGGHQYAFTSSPADSGGFDLTLDGTRSHIAGVVEGHELYLRTRNGRFDLHWVDPFGGDDEEQVGEDKIVAPLPGTVVALLAEVGATLEKGAPILTLEVMKMEQTLRAPFAGVLKAIKCKVGDIVQEGVELAEIEPTGGRDESGRMSDQVRIVEVGPRDGLQNEKTPVSAEARIAFIEALVAAGLQTIEVGAFVSPKAIPQMVNSDQVLRGLGGLNGEFHVLVPNEKGYDAARAAGAEVIAVFASASEGFSRANINCSVAESIERFKPVVARAKADGIKVRGYVSCVLGCPYDGEVKPQAVVDVREAAVGSRLLRSVARRHHRRRHAAQGAASVARGKRCRADGKPRDAFPRHLRAGARQSLCRDGGGRARDRFRGGRPRRLPLCAGCDRQRRDRGCGLHAGRHGHCDRRRYEEAGGRDQRDQPPDRPGAGQPCRCGDECEEIVGSASGASRRAADSVRQEATRR